MGKFEPKGKKIFGDAIDFYTDDNEIGSVEEIDIDLLVPFHDHPFRLYEGERLDDMVESIKTYGVMTPVIVRKQKNNYEILAGHNRTNAAKAIAEPLSTIDKVTIIDGSGNGGESGVGSMGAYVPQVLAKTIESVKETTGIDITEIMRANTYDAKVNKNVNLTGIDTVKVQVESPRDDKAYDDGFPQEE